jgi:hypothetical protein
MSHCIVWIMAILNLLPFNTILSSGERNKWHIAKHGCNGRSRKTVIWLFAKNSHLNKYRHSAGRAWMAAIWCMFCLLFRILWTGPNEVPDMFATSRAVILVFLRKHLLQSTFFCFARQWTPRAFSFWTWKTTKKTYVLYLICSVTAPFKILKVSVAFRCV